jgi:hypothetical protein
MKQPCRVSLSVVAILVGMATAGHAQRAQHAGQGKASHPTAREVDRVPGILDKGVEEADIRNMQELDAALKHLNQFNTNGADSIPAATGERSPNSIRSMQESSLQ